MNTKRTLLALSLAIGSIALTGAAPGDEKKDEKKPAAEAKKDDAKPADPAAGDPKGPPFGEAPKKASDEPRPAERAWTVKAGEFEVQAKMKPGVPDPEQLTEIIILASAIPKTPNPRFGSRVPLEGASILVDLVSPAKETIGRYVAHPMPLTSNQYGLHFTPKQEGIYTLSIKGTSAEGKAFTAEIKLPVKVWPLPEELKGAGDVDKGAGGRKPLK